MSNGFHNILATVRAALGEVHGVEKMNAALSDFYMVDEIQGTYRGIMIAIPAEHWQPYDPMSLTELTEHLKDLGAKVNLKQFLKQPCKKKKTPPPKRVKDSKHPHVSTAKFLSNG
jgi:hypothetical protein